MTRKIGLTVATIVMYFFISAASAQVQQQRPYPDSPKQSPVQQQPQQGKPWVTFGQVTSSGLSLQGTRFRPGMPYNVYVNGQIIDGGNYKTIQSDGTFTFQIYRQNVNVGDQVKVLVQNQYGSGQNFVVEVRAQGDSQYSDYEIREYANIQARTVANRVAETYGVREAWKNSFVIGFLGPFSEYRRIDSGAGRREYENAQGDGYQKGETDSVSATQREANSSALKMARKSVRDLFAAVVDRQEEPNTTLRTPQLSFTGVKANAKFEPLFNQRVQSLDAQLDGRLAQWHWFYSGDGLWKIKLEFSLFDALEYFDGNNSSNWGFYRFETRFFTSSYAFDEWQYNRLGGQYDHSQYNQYSYDEKEKFRSYFYDVYTAVIQDKYENKKNVLHIDANLLGNEFGRYVGEAYAYSQGYVAGYNSRFETHSREIFNGLFESAYKSAFYSEVERYQTNAVLEIVTANLIDSNRDGFFEPNEEVGVVVQKLLNLGRVPFRGTARLTGNAIQSLTSSETIELGASSSNGRASVTAPRLGRLQKDLIADQNYNLVLHIGGATQNLDFSMSWQSVLGGTREGMSPSLERLILDNIKAEWEKANPSSAGGNWYKNGKPDGSKTKLETLVNYYEESNDPEVRRSLSSLYDSLWKIVIKNKWDIRKHGPKRKAYLNLCERLTK